MMEFLRGLGPHHAHGTSNAVAALPSRFETDRPLRGALSPVVPPGLHQEGSGEPAHRLAAPLSQAPSHAGVAAPSRTADGQQSAPPRRERVATATASDDAHRAAPSRTRVDASPPTPSAHLPMKPRPGANPARALSLPAVALALTGGATDAPLSKGSVLSSAMAARAAQSADRRPIVHVTIDRIDVRAPAAPEPAKPPAGPRSASSTRSLTEYLGARQSGRRGGTS
jgi:hypothetical protein